ncbi:oxygen-binding di-iron domain-containing protein [Salinispira pacifica]
MPQSDTNGRILYEDNDHKFIWLGADPVYRKGVVQTNQFLIIDRGVGILLDPGGVHLFSRVVSMLSRYIPLDKIEHIFFSHQDPDVSSGITLWLGVTRAKVYISDLWVRFLPHFGIVDNSRMVPIPDGGSSLRLPSGAQLRFIPSHFLHSVGSFCAFDDRASILFSSDIGAAVFPEGKERVMVEDFTEHLPYIDAFHKRYMCSNAAVRKWVSMVEPLSPRMICPQHGAIYEGDSVRSFLGWMRELRCGIDLVDDIYRS